MRMCFVFIIKVCWTIFSDPCMLGFIKQFLIFLLNVILKNPITIIDQV